MKYVKYLCLFLLCGIFSFSAISCSSNNPINEEYGTVIKATISVKNFGNIELELYPDIAPQSVYNFVYLAREGHYDGTIFHRIVPNFVIQGGGYEPGFTQRDWGGYNIKGEFSENGIDNPLSHERGVISWARVGGLNDSATCQFFICHQNAQSSLDGLYAAFGKVVSGMEVVDAIAATTCNGETPVEDVIITSIKISGPELPEPDFIK